jgi:hypothetical protein
MGRADYKISGGIRSMLPFLIYKIMEKICKSCNIELDISLFYKKSGSCKECENKLKRIKYKENRISELERVKNYQKNSSKRKEWQKKYYEENKNNINSYNNTYKKNKLKSDPIFRIKNSLSVSIRRAFKNLNYTKKSKIYDIIGCSKEEFKLYIESKFEPWMNWNNHGLYNGELNYGWDIDHIIPISSASTEDELIKLNHYTNLQPLCSYINRCVKINNI